MATYRTTSRNQIRTPSGAVGDPPDGPGGMATLADDIDGFLGVGGAEYAANLAAINAIPTARCFDGKLAYAADTQYQYRYTVPATGANGWVLWQTPWVPFAGTRAAPAFPTGFQNPGFDDAPAWRVNGGDAFLAGVAQKTGGAAFAGSDNLWTVPAVITPTTTRYFLLNGGGSAFGSLQINATGAISVHSVKGTAPVWLSLDGWSWRIR